jgi:DNA-directed RNA polymerase omega subunit
MPGHPDAHLYSFQSVIHEQEKSKMIERVEESGPTKEISRFRLVVVAGLRAKQLLHDSKPRIEADLKRRKNTTIALEEVRRGLIIFHLH